MKTIVMLIAIATSVAGVVLAEAPVAFHPGTGVPNPGQGDSRAMWSEPPDLNGLLGSSEQILQLGLETELANDFIPTETTVTHATWWGGYFNNTTPCEPGIPTPGFNLEFFETDDCLPGQIIASISTTDFTEESVGCQSDSYPLYKWGAYVAVDVVPGNRYWFCAQVADHAFPPQGGRLASVNVVGCDGAFRGAYFGYPDWTDWCDYWVCPDFSQEFEGDHSEACCFADGHCEFILTGACAANGGIAQGPGSVCDPNPCQPTPTKATTWGRIRLEYR
jgi:hypothetical protein